MSKLKKFFIVSFFVVLLFVLYQIDCFAGIDFDVTDDIISKANTVANGSDYILFTDNYYLWLCILDDNCYFYVSNNRLYSSNGGYEAYKFYTDEFIYNTRFSSLDGNSFSYYYSTKDIMAGTDTDEVFFHRTPLGITATLVEETQKAEIMEQMKIMIVGFLKYLIVLVISLIAFWKGWQFLSTQLRKA